MLEGKLTDFSLPEVFQLLALTRKSGTLNINAGTSRGRIVFDEGEISFAVADVEREAVGTRLVQAGLATREEVISVLEAKRAEGLSGNLSQALLESVDISQEAREAFLRSSIADAVFELMRLEDASFAFDTSRRTGATGSVSVPTAELVAEGERRLGEWAAIREQIPSPDAVLVINPNVGPGGRSVTADQWAVLALIDGRRNVRDLIGLSGKGEFTTTRLLAGMVLDGLVEVAGEGGTALAELQARRDQLHRIEALELGTYTKSGGIARAARDAIAGGPAQRRPQETAPQPPSQPATPTATPATTTPSPASPAAPGARPQGQPSPRPAVVRPTALEQRQDTASLAPAPTAEPARAPARPASAGAAVPAAHLMADLLGADTDTPAPAPGRNDQAKPAPASAPEPRPVDRSQMVRELAALGLADDSAAPQPQRGDAAADTDPLRRLTRDEEVNRGLLLRLIDGVKGA